MSRVRFALIVAGVVVAVSPAAGCVDPFDANSGGWGFPNGRGDDSGSPDAIGADDSTRADDSTLPAGGDGAATQRDSGVGSGNDSGSDGGPILGDPRFPYYGHVYAIAQPTGDGGTAYSLGAVFAATPDSGMVGACAGATIFGSCCSTHANSSFNGPAYGAGTITVKDGSKPLSTMTLDSNGLYLDMSPTLQWMVGDGLSFSASGGTVHAFAASVVAPGPIEGISPPLENLYIGQGSDLTITWTPGMLSGVRMVLDVDVINGTGASDGYFVCVEPDSAGAITVPQMLLSQFPANDSASIALFRESVLVLANDNATVQVNAVTFGP